MPKSIQIILRYMALICTNAILALITTGMVSTQNVEKSYFRAEASPVKGTVCPHHKVNIHYVLTFVGMDYENERKRKNEPILISIAHPILKITASQGTITNVDFLNKEYQDDPVYDPVMQTWSSHFTFTPDKPGRARINLVAEYMKFVARTSWDVRVWEDCKYTVEISANESGFKMSSGKTVNEEQKDWSIIEYLKGKAKGVLADPLENEGGEGGQKRLAAFPKAVWLRDDVAGTNEMFGDGIWLNKEPDFICGTGGPITCESTFTVHPVPGEETIDFQITMNSGQCSSFTVWCKGPEGGGQVTVPPMRSLSFEMNAVIPREGGSAHYIHQLPYGITMDYLISAYPEKEE